jgi:23S rRNA-/tRNA-specific pseudouridylate synthase
VRVDLPLRRDGDRRHRTVVDAERGKPSQTELRLLEAFHGCALVEARPRTGRTHQIRAHLSAIGLPLLGDPLYRLPGASRASVVGVGPPDRAGLMPRTALHATTLILRHPCSEKRVTYRAPYPADLSGALDQLRTGA